MRHPIVFMLNSSSDPNVRWTAFKIALIYVLVAVTWNFGSDALLQAFVSRADERILIDVIKDCGFAILTGGLLFVVLWRMLAKSAKEAEQRRRMEEAAREPEAKYRNLF